MFFHENNSVYQY